MKIEKSSPSRLDSAPQHFLSYTTKAPLMAGPPWSNVTLWVDCATLTRLLVPSYPSLHTAAQTQLHPVVLPHVSHFRHVPLRTSVKFEHSGQASPT